MALVLGLVGVEAGRAAAGRRQELRWREGSGKNPRGGWGRFFGRVKARPFAFQTGEGKRQTVLGDRGHNCGSEPGGR